MASSFNDGVGTEILDQPEQPVVDICFIHGLGGGRVTTWKKGEVLWPYDLLGRNILEARIITWGYNADIAHFLGATSDNRIKDHAASLFKDLSSLRSSSETSKRPIIFVAHSLGGLICAESVLQSSIIEPQDAAKICDHTAAFAFMGTPFEGSDTARWTDRFVKLAQLTPDFNVNKTLLDALKQDSHVLKTLGEDFPKWLRDRKGPVGQPIHVMCFYEELSTVGIGQVVPRESASIPGHPSSSMNDNHVGICKFDNFEDPKYKNILHTLRGWVDEIKAAAKSEEPKGKFDVQVHMKAGHNYGGEQIGHDASTGRSGSHGHTYNFGKEADK